MKRRFVIFIIGIFILALGISLALKANLGVSPVSSLPYALTLAFSNTSFAITMGMWTTIFNLFYYFIQLIGQGKNFPKLQHGQIFLAFFLGTFIDFTTFLINWMSADLLIFRVIYLLLGVYLIALGIIFMFESDVSYSNAEGLALFIANKLNVSFTKVKVTLDLTHVILAIIIVFFTTKDFSVIGVGTIITVLGVGPLIGYMTPFYSKYIERFLNG